MKHTIAGVPLSVILRSPESWMSPSLRRSLQRFQKPHRASEANPDSTPACSSVRSAYSYIASSFMACEPRRGFTACAPWRLVSGSVDLNSGRSSNMVSFRWAFRAPTGNYTQRGGAVVDIGKRINDTHHLICQPCSKERQRSYGLGNARQAASNATASSA